MFETKTGLRKIATLLAISAFLLGTSAPAGASAPYQKTVNYLASKFEDKKFIEGFTPGKADFGFTVEALLQLRSAGFSASKMQLAVTHNLQSASVAGTATKVGSLFVDKKFQTGRGGMFLVASKAYSLPQSTLKTTVLKLVKANVKSTGEVIDANGNTFIYGWTILGLKASGETKLAASVANKLASLARPDGGFGTDQTGDTLTSSADATGMALMALASVSKSKSGASENAVAWLTRNITEDHFKAWGEVDVNGTAYALMGLNAVGKPNDSVTEWLQGQVVKTGGLITSYSKGAANIYATAQGYIALIGSSYVALIK